MNSTPQFQTPDDSTRRLSLPPEQPTTMAYSRSYPTPDYYTDDAGVGYAPPPHRVDDSRERTRLNPVVELRWFLGGLAATAVVAGLLTYVGAVIIEVITTRWVPVDYWMRHELAAPSIDGAWWAWLAALGAAAAAAVMWTLLVTTNLAGRFFTALASLAAIGVGVGTWVSGPWQTTLGPTALGVLVTVVIGGLTDGYTRRSITEPDRY